MTVRYYFAPLEGVTGFVYRAWHSRIFGGVDQYYMPFVSPAQSRRFTSKQLRDLLPEHNEGVPAVPQLLTKNAEDFIWAAQCLAEMGYREVNLNLGCPSGTVVAKGKGSGMLRDPEALDRFWDAVFSAQLPVAVSAKTRLGLENEQEFDALLRVFGRYPFSELIVHPRVREDYYKGKVKTEAFAAALEQLDFPVCWSGDLFCTQDVQALQARFPGLSAAMLGRGAVSNPALFRMLRGGAPATREELEQFLSGVFDGCTADFGSEKNAMLRMKEIWFYLICLFEGSEKLDRRLRRARDPQEFRQVTQQILQTLPLRAQTTGSFAG